MLAARASQALAARPFTAVRPLPLRATRPVCMATPKDGQKLDKSTPESVWKTVLSAEEVRERRDTLKQAASRGRAAVPRKEE